MRRYLGRVLLSLSLLMPCGVELSAETYVVPIWASGLAASDGSWWAQAVLINPHAFPVTFQVTRVFPLATRPCPIMTCRGGVADVATIQPNGFRIVQPHSSRPGEDLIAAAFEVQSSAALHIHLVAYRPGVEREIRQRLEVARGWLGPGTHNISSVEFAVFDVRMNVFVINPSETPLEVAVWTLNRAENEVRASIPPMSMRVVRLPEPICGGGPCSFPDRFPPLPLPIHVETNGAFMATVSSVGKSWAVFSLPDAAGAQ